MKKLLLVLVVAILGLTSLFGQAVGRTLTHEIRFAAGDTRNIFDYVTAVSPNHTSNYFFSVTSVALGETRSTTTNLPAVIRVCKAGSIAVLSANQSMFPSIWPVGSVLTLTLTYTPTNETITKDVVVPAGTGSFSFVGDANAWYGIPPAPVVGPTYQLTVNSNIAGSIATGGTAAVGQATPWTSEALDAATTLVGTYSMTPIPGGTWAPASIEVEATNFVAEPTKGGKALLSKTIAFTWTADSYVYRLNVNGPDGYTVTGPNIATGGTTDYFMIAGNVNNVIGDFTIAAAPAGFHWVENPINVEASDYVLQTKSAQALGSRNDGSKATFNYEYTIEFVLEADVVVDTYILNVNGPDGYAVTGPVSDVTDYVATDDNAADLAGDYTIAAAPAGWHWVMNPITVATTDFVMAGKGGKDVPGATYTHTIEFVLEEDAPVYDIPAGTPTAVDDVTITSPVGLNYGVPSPGQNAVVVALPNFSNLTDSFVTVLTGSGDDVTFTIEVTTPGLWYGLAYYGGTWHQAAPYMMVVPPAGTFTFNNVDFDAKGDVIILLGEGVDPTLPVELSVFNAVLTAQNFVKLSWISESETNMLGYRVYRSESAEQANAMMITPIMIEATNTSSTANYSLEDREVYAGNTYYYWLEAVDFGHSQFFGPQSVIVTADTTPELPVQSALKNAYPNPFKANSNTTIEVAVKAGETGTVTVYNVLGQAVKTFSVSEGSHNLKWNGRDSKNNICGSGIYFYKLSTPSMNQTKKMVIVK